MSEGRNDLEGIVTWKSPSNIALIKYWGKHGDQLPNNPSLSFTLANAYTQTSIAYRKRTLFSDPVSLDFRFNGSPNPDFANRIRQYLSRIQSEFSCIRNCHLQISSSNSFPHSAGIASSASAFSALALALCDIENHISGDNPDLSAFMKKASYFARLGSGSACRSLYPRAALWGRINALEFSSDESAIPLQDYLHPVFHTFRDAILIVSQQKKTTSSSAGHKLMENHPYAQVRYEEAKKNLLQLLPALQKGDVERVGTISEMEAMQLHALMLCSNPNYILLQPDTLKIIEGIKHYRMETKSPVYFTLDAGPNVHLLYPASQTDSVKIFIRDHLLRYCQDARWIDDEVGAGPVKLESL